MKLARSKGEGLGVGHRPSHHVQAALLTLDDTNQPRTFLRLPKLIYFLQTISRSQRLLLEALQVPSRVETTRCSEVLTLNALNTGHNCSQDVPMKLVTVGRQQIKSVSNIENGK